ncbi:ADP-ribosylglycohydrolase family protein [bacterium]|nr:ADP-ribosylglycohydrolase family protein [bacterium]
MLKADQVYLRLPVREYVDKMMGGWLGQMVGVGWGAPTEFRHCDEIIADSEVPSWEPSMVNQFYQDDLYVDVAFISALDKYGLDITPKQAGIHFAKTKFGLAHANWQGRVNLRQGIAPPDSGHPQFNPHADDIDYQIESDFSGLIAPGVPFVPIKYGEIFGRIMNYGDGVYAGQFVGAMYSYAFFEKDMVKIVEAALRCIPQGSQYHECISDVLRWYKENPNDWKATWWKVKEKYQENPDYRRFSCSGPNTKFNIDAKINGAYVVIGLLYGNGDIERTIRIAMQCGQDSDCNPSTAAGILFTTIGFSHIPEKFKEKLDRKAKFAGSDYDFDKLVDVSLALARQVILKIGGKVIKDANGEEIFLIPRKSPRPSRLEQSWNPAPIKGSKFSDEEMKEIEEALR